MRFLYFLSEIEACRTGSLPVILNLVISGALGMMDISTRKSMLIRSNDVHVLRVSFGSELRTGSFDSRTHEYLSRIKLQVELVIHQSFQLVVIFFCILSVPLFMDLLH